MTASPGYFTVTQTVDDSNPTLTPAQGSVTFTPNLSSVDSTTLDEVIYIEAVTGYLGVGGLLNAQGGAVELLDNVNLNLATGELTYLVEYSVTGSAATTPAFRIAAPGNGAALDLSVPSNQLPAEL